MWMYIFILPLLLPSSHGLEYMASGTDVPTKIPKISKVFYIWNISRVETMVPVVPKCCPVGESRVKNKHSCMETKIQFHPIFWNLTPPTKVNLLIGERCKYGSYRLNPQDDCTDEFHLLSNGSLYTPYYPHPLISLHDYCLETFELEGGKVKVLPLICFPPSDPWKEMANVLYLIGCLISVLFLLATFVIHLMFPELRVLQGKVLCCYSLCLACAYFCLTIIQIWGENIKNNICIIIVYLIQFFFVAGFNWLHVMCYHTWRKMKYESLGKKSMVNEKQRFFIYSFYGWGFPLLILAVTLIMMRKEGLTPNISPSYINPDFGSDCMTLYYFYGPITVLLGISVVFILLARKYLHVNPYKGKLMNIHNITKELIIKRRRHRFIQTLLLVSVMGLNWILSWRYGQDCDNYVELCTIVNTFYTLQGVGVFLIFVIGDDLARSLICQKLNRSRLKAFIPTNSLV